jgi:hypothetical protein
MPGDENGHAVEATHITGHRGGENNMNVNQTCRAQHAVSGATPGLPKAKRKPETVVKELAELVRDLHQLLGNYAPSWYSQKMDARISEELAAADWALLRENRSTVNTPGEAPR